MKKKTKILIILFILSSLISISTAIYFTDDSNLWHSGTLISIHLQDDGRTTIITRTLMNHSYTIDDLNGWDIESYIGEYVVISCHINNGFIRINKVSIENLGVIV